MSQRVYNAPIGRDPLFSPAVANQRSEAARGHLVAGSAVRVHSCCRERRGSQRSGFHRLVWRLD